MAFDAGSIEATLILNRNPFTAGLLAAKRQAEEFQRRNKIELPVTVKLDRSSLARVKQEINKAVGNIKVKAQLDRASLARVRQQIEGVSGNVRVRFSIDRASLARLRAELRAQSFTINVRINTDRSLLSQLTQLRQQTQGLGGDFDVGGSRFARMASLIIGLLPVIASGFTAAVGAVGALTSAFLIAGLGAGALALVAVPAFKQIRAAVVLGQGAIDKLPDGLRQAANALKELLAEYDNLVKANQKLVGIGISAWLNAGTAALKTLYPLVKASANAFGDAGLQAIMFFEGPWWQRFVNFLSRAIWPAVDALTRSIFALIRIVGNLTMAFWDLGGSQILDMIVKGLEQFATWTDHIGQNKSFQAFMDAAVRSFPVVATLIGDLVVFILKLAAGLEPLGTIIIRVFNGIFEAINQLPPPMIAALAFAVGSLMAALALGAGGPVALGIAAIAGLATIFADVYTRSETLRNGINGFVDDLRTRFMPIWDTIVRNFNQFILPAWQSLVDMVQQKLIPALQRFGDVFLQEVWPKIQPFVDQITETLIPAILRFLGALTNIISFLIDVFGPTVARELGAAVTVFQGSFDMIAGLLDIFTGIFTGNWTTFTQGITEITRGFWTIIAGLFGTNLDGLKATMQRWDQEIDAMWHTFWDGLTGWFKGLWEGIKLWWSGFLDILRGDTDQGAQKIGDAWRKIANLFRDPINWVINTVINDGIIGAWNTVMGWIGVGGISGRVPSLPAFAAGGPVSGGIKGKDSVPILAQQGEYVLSVPAVQRMGGIGAVDAMHTAARGGRAGGPTFAQGGPIGIPHYAVGGPVAATTQVSMWSIFGSQVANLFHSLGFGNSPMGGQIGAAISRIPGALVTKVLEAAQKKLESVFQTIVTFLGGGGGGGGGVGLGGGDARAWIIAHESGGNPRAQNPTSSASGLYQFIDGTWRALGGSTAHAKDASVAEQNMIADRYVAQRYGGWAGAQAFWQAHGWYDKGGWLQPGTTIAHNLTGKPELIIPMDQIRPGRGSLSPEDIAAIVAALRGGGSGGGDVYNVMLPEKATVRELADSLDFKRRVVSKGRYTR